MQRRVGQKRDVLKFLPAAACALAVALGSTAWRWARTPRAWAAGKVPVAFWAWRAETPSQAEVDRAARETGARVLFVRAGQFESAGGNVRRIRAVAGRFPRSVELHLVYNSTRELLSDFERVDEGELAAAVAATFSKDRERAARDGAHVAGLQLDIDAPTRLLARYARVLRLVRGGLAPATSLSVTGLPTWMNSAELKNVLAAVDFWAPQFYGSVIPDALHSSLPISSPGDVARDVARARELGKPFYAGLAAYGHALLYSPGGRLIELRGDIDPARVARDPNFQLVERRPFDMKAASAGEGPTQLADTNIPTRGAGGDLQTATPSNTASPQAPRASEWRYVFRAHNETVLDGLVVRAGEHILFDMPSSESLRAGVRGVRREAGDKLLGILLFRLPTVGDSSALGLGQVAAALLDAPARVSTGVQAERAAAGVGPGGVADSEHLVLTATNDGAAGALVGFGALTVTLSVPRGDVRGVAALDGFDSFETLCDAGERLVPCGPPRATVVRLRAQSWAVGARARARLSFEGGVPEALACSVVMRVEDGRVWERVQGLKIEGVGREGEGGGR